MPEVPTFNKKPYSIQLEDQDKYSIEPATVKQKNFIFTLYERHELPIPDLTEITKRKAMILIDSLKDSYQE